jgi:hypothetical protein
MPEVAGNRAQEEFILSIRGLDDSWAASQLQELVKKEQKGEGFTSTPDLIAEFRSYYRRTRPVASGLGTFATLEAASSQNHETQQSARGVSGTWTRKCLCGQIHRFNACPYVNEAVRTKSWKPDVSIQDKFTELRNSSVSNLTANALRAAEKRLKKDKNQTADKSETVISMDDGQPAGGSPHVNAVLQTVVATELSAPPLLTRWILDPGLNCHVTNRKDSSWNTTKKGVSSDVVYAGGALAQVEEWGETTVQVKTPTGEGQIKLTWVAYIPGFFTSCQPSTSVYMVHCELHLT